MRFHVQFPDAAVRLLPCLANAIRRPDKHTPDVRFPTTASFQENQRAIRKPAKRTQLALPKRVIPKTHRLRARYLRY